MKERIIWIDWAKALAVCCVVFCHLPQSQDWFYYRYLQADIITIFFFISGYLKKDHGSDKANWQKYWHSLILPYLFYNAIVYPYWLVKFYMLNGDMPDLFQALRPIFGALLLICQTFSKPYVPFLAPYSSNMRTLSANRLMGRFGICLPSYLCTLPSICAEKPSISISL